MTTFNFSAGNSHTCTLILGTQLSHARPQHVTHSGLQDKETKKE